MSVVCRVKTAKMYPMGSVTNACYSRQTPKKRGLFHIRYGSNAEAQSHASNDTPLLEEITELVGLGSPVPSLMKSLDRPISPLVQRLQIRRFGGSVRLASANTWKGYQYAFGKPQAVDAYGLYEDQKCHWAMADLGERSSGISADRSARPSIGAWSPPECES